VHELVIKIEYNNMHGERIKKKKNLEPYSFPTVVFVAFFCNHLCLSRLLQMKIESIRDVASLFVYRSLQRYIEVGGKSTY